MSGGHSIRLPRSLVEQAVLKRIQEIAKARGIQVPADPLDFAHSAGLHFLDSRARPATLDSVVVTWND